MSLDVSALNKFVRKTNATVMSAIRKGEWMFSVDLKDAYFQTPIHQESRKFLRFCWRNSVMQFKAMCFGLTTAPYVLQSQCFCIAKGFG